MLVNDHIQITEEEDRTLAHWSMWGSDGYPVEKYGAGWHVKYFPNVFKTKKEAIVKWEAYIDTLIKRKGIDAYNNEMTRRGIS
jgi:hypothetical protein